MIVTNFKKMLFLIIAMYGCSSVKTDNNTKTCFFIDENYVFIKFNDKDNFPPLILSKVNNDIIIKQEYFKLIQDSLYLSTIGADHLNITDHIEKPKVDMNFIEVNNRLQGFKFNEKVNVIIYQNKIIEKCKN